MRTPRQDKRRSERNVVSLREWQKTARKEPDPHGPRAQPLWAIWVVLALVAAAISWYESSAVGGTMAASDTFTCTVDRITDGDTFRCSDGTRIRLSAIAARESDGSCAPDHPCPSASAAAATEALSRLALQRTFTCEADGRSYDRVTAWCADEAGTQLNCAMVEGGYAERWEKFDPAGRLCRKGSE